MFILIILIIPLLLGLASLAIKRPRPAGVLNAAGYGLMLAVTVMFVSRFMAGQAPVRLYGLLYVDVLSVFFMLTTSIVAFAASIYSIGYISAEAAEKKISNNKVAAYYGLFNLFCFTMLLVQVLNNLALVWIAIEMTTLVSAFLVGFHNTKESVEAAWKYIIICSVGIAFALLGIIFFYYTSFINAGVKSLEWERMLAGAQLFDPRIVKIALLLIITGYGTKAGFAPMHNWLPDAHSQALSPISGLLSGVLLKTALYAMLRCVILANPSVGYAFSAKLFLLYGMCSLGIAAGFILVQKDLKRLFAYSSVENIGLISIGFGFGPTGGIFAGLFHVFNHAVTKALMFFGSGNIVKAFRTNNMRQMRGALKVLPFTGTAMLLGVFALVGMPPFSSFISKLLLLMAAFKSGRYFVAASVLCFAGLAFAGLVYHITKVIFGNRPAGISGHGDSLSTKIAFVFLGIFIVWFGVRMPGALFDMFNSCQKLILGQ